MIPKAIGGVVAVTGAVAGGLLARRGRPRQADPRRWLAVTVNRAPSDLLPGGSPPAPLAELSEGERRRVTDLATRFLSSALAGRARAAAALWIEAPLAVRLEASEPSGTQLLDGQLDLAFQEAGGWIVVDYKYSRPSESAADEAQEGQMRWYCAALSAASGRAVREAWLFYLDDGVSRSVQLQEG